MTPTDKSFINGYLLGVEDGKEEPMGKVKFEQIGVGYAGFSDKTGKSHINLRLDEKTASDIVYGDLCSGVYLFKSTAGDGQYSVCAPVKK